MNDKGNVIILILIGFVFILVVPPIILAIFPAARILFQIASVFIIYTTIRGYLGDGILTIIVAAILIYYFVFKWFYLFSALYVFQMLLGIQFISVVTWTIGTVGRGFSLGHLMGRGGHH